MQHVLHFAKMLTQVCFSNESGLNLSLKSEGNDITVNQNKLAKQKKTKNLGYQLHQIFKLKNSKIKLVSGKFKFV